MLKAAVFLVLFSHSLADPSCGQTPVKPNLDDSTRIAGGTVAVPYSWPWQVVLCSVGWAFGCSLECGGTVIANGWILTGKRQSSGVAESEYDEQIANVKSIHIHPKFDSPTLNYDIALIKLQRPFEYDKHLQPVCLPSSDTAAVSHGNSGWVTGWGATTQGGSYSAKLRQAKVPFVDFTTCNTENSNLVNDALMICAGKEGIDACAGDAGDALAVQGASGSWFQVGVDSWGLGCAKAGHPGVYSRVSAFCDFIESTTGGNAKCQPIA